MIAQPERRDIDPVPTPEPANQIIPAGYTYLGQFVDHDITFDPVSSLQRQNDPQGLQDFRTPGLDLDSLYGRGPADQPYLYRNGPKPDPHAALGFDHPHGRREARRRLTAHEQACQLESAGHGEQLLKPTGSGSPIGPATRLSTCCRRTAIAERCDGVAMGAHAVAVARDGEDGSVV